MYIYIYICNVMCIMNVYILPIYSQFVFVNMVWVGPRMGETPEAMVYARSRGPEFRRVVKFMYVFFRVRVCVRTHVGVRFCLCVRVCVLVSLCGGSR